MLTAKKKSQLWDKDGIMRKSQISNCEIVLQDKVAITRNKKSSKLQLWGQKSQMCNKMLKFFIAC